ncbi:MAG: KamA family radical SAM protein [Acidobacteria bacterium]|nr:KamA family radical SAM protein [Acidobacteriota bacterium]
MQEKYRHRLLKILSILPDLQEIMTSSLTLEVKRGKIRKFLDMRLVHTFADDPNLPALKWVLSREAILVFRNILSPRSEKLAGYSLLEYINDLLSPDKKNLPRPTSDFFAELEHLFLGISGKADVYPETVPNFSKHHGLKAARLRSTDLSRMARSVKKHTKRFPTGLDDKIMRLRYGNRERILRYFAASETEWNDWKWQARNIIKKADTLRSLIKLTDEELGAVQLAEKNRIPFGITPYYLSLIDNEPGLGNDTAVRAQVIPSLHYIKTILEYREGKSPSQDFMLEQDTSPIEGITRRYPQIVILKPILTCPQICVYCQRNWEIEDVYSQSAVLPKPKLQEALDWLAERPEITEVLITGGDPFLLSGDRIENLLYKLSNMAHIVRIRIGTRTPVTLPQRITDGLVKIINRYHIPGKREVLIITHFEHPYEITPQSMEAVQKFRRYGMDVYNQMVYTFYNSRKFEAAALRNKLRLIGVTSYYTFNTKGKEETNDFRVPMPRLMQEQEEEARLMPGSVRTDEIVFNVPGLGKNYLGAVQHHSVISILPSGRRVYEFHPWEKKLSLADTYVYTDVSIYSYLQKLKSIGENLADYKSIWFYY